MPKLALTALIVAALCVGSIVGYLAVGPGIFTITVPIGVGLIMLLQLESAARIQAGSAATRARVAGARAETESAYRQLEALVSVFSMIDVRAPLPPMRGWAISPDFARTMLSVLATRRPRVVLEAGSGVSTLIAAYGAERLGLDCRIHSLDHDAHFVEFTKVALAEHGLTHAATIVHAPLVPIDINGEEWKWYDRHALQALEKIDLVVIDGPPAGDGAPLARYPALPVLCPRLSKDAVVLVDDGARRGEQAVVKRWQQEFPEIQVKVVDNEKGAFLIRVNGASPAWA
ncbi:MAG: class I SAM-dependent methyltransferase [Acidimicrobiia bacterium]